MDNPTRITLRDRHTRVKENTPILGAGWGRRVIGAILGMVLTLFALRKWGNPGSVDDEVFVIGAGIATIVLMVGGEYAWHFVRARGEILALRLSAATEELDRLRRVRAPSVSFSVSLTRPPVSPVGVQALIVRVGIKNNGPSDDFQAQVVGWASNSVEVNPIPAETLRWENGDGRFHKIAPGATEHLLFAGLERHAAPESDAENPHGPVGVAEVTASWVSHFRYLGAYAYWAAKPVNTQVWSVHIIVTSLGSQAPQSQGVRLHLFSRAADDPTGRLERDVEHPILRATLFDLKP